MGYYSELDYEQSSLCAAGQSPEEPAEPVPAPTLDYTAETDDTKARKAHEAAEAQRKAQWDAAQEKKRMEEQGQLDRIAGMNEDALRLAAVRRISIATDKMTNRSMKDSVSAHIQAICEKDLTFARMTMHPRKSMLHCIQYIFRHAKDYLEKELKAGGVNPNGVYGGDVPDGLCLQWAEDYFRNPDAKEDQEPDDKFIPKPYIKPYKPKPAEPKPAPMPKGHVDGQISLLGEAS